MNQNEYVDVEIIAGRKKDSIVWGYFEFDEGLEDQEVGLSIPVQGMSAE